MKYIFLIFVITLVSCDWVKQKTKETVNKSGEIVAKTGSEFANGISKGVEQTFTAEVNIDSKLLDKGISTGKIVIRGTDTTNDNIVSVYLIFNKPFNQKITAKVFTQDGLECGRVTQTVVGNKDDAKYVDFVFDKRTNIDLKGKIVFN
jgi:hypothetical protein